jgi:bacterioferritin (cytochrome b1)
MAKTEDTPKVMQGSAAEIAALARVEELETDLFNWSHLEEHWFESQERDSLAAKFDKAGEHARDRRRVILDRIFQLGGTVKGVEDDPMQALQEWLDRLTALHTACQEAYNACSFADGSEDYVTQIMLTENQEWIEEKMKKLERKIIYFKAIGPQLAEVEWE